MDQHRDRVCSLQPDEGQPDTCKRKDDTALDTCSSEEATGAHELHHPVEPRDATILEGLLGEQSLLEQRSRGELVRGHKPDLTILEERKDFVPYGPSSLLKTVKVLREFQLLEEANRKFFESQRPFREREDLTSEQGEPAAGERSHVEQQAEEEGSQLQQEDVRESKDR